jgi:hypothetical protein
MRLGEFAAREPLEDALIREPQHLWSELASERKAGSVAVDPVTGNA